MKMYRWLFCVAALFFSSQNLMAQVPIEAVTFDQSGGTGTQSTPFPISLTTIAEGDTVSFFKMISSGSGGPEGTGFGAAVAWLENGTDIKAITFAQNGGGALSTSGVLNLATVSPGAVVTDLLLGGSEPQTSGLGAVVVWVENGVNIKAVTFDALGMSSFISSTISLGTAAAGASFFRLTGDFPESSANEAVVAWVEGLNIKAVSFYQNNVSGSSAPLDFMATVSGPITDFQLTGRTSAFDIFADGNVAIAWVESGVNIKAVPLNCATLSLGSVSSGVAQNFQLVGTFPATDVSGAAVAWMEDGANFKAVTFQCTNSGVEDKSPILSLGSASGTVTDLQLIGSFPEASGSGAAIAWVENGTDIKAITFNAYITFSFTKTSPLLLASATSGMISNFRFVGSSPEAAGAGAAVAWTENGTDIKAVTFNAFDTTSTISPPISLGTTLSNIGDFAFTGNSPETVGKGAAVAWILVPQTVTTDTPRSWKRPSNPRVRH